MGLRFVVDVRHLRGPTLARIVRAARVAGARVLGTPAQDLANAYRVDDQGRIWNRGRKEARILRVTDAASQRRASRMREPIVVHTPGWTVVPLENLLASRRYATAAVATSADQIPSLLGLLGIGVDGILLRTSDPTQVRRAARLLDGHAKKNQVAPPRLRLRPAVVTRVADAGMADRACLDTTTKLREGEGFLIGSSASSAALVLAETARNAFLAPRPFRVNAGALHQYVAAPAGAPYVSELRAGAAVLAVSRRGRSRAVSVGRCKIEPRPHVMVRWKTRTVAGWAILQLAETVRLATPKGAKAVTSLSVGDKILVAPMHGQRHAGRAIAAKVVER